MKKVSLTLCVLLLVTLFAVSCGGETTTTAPTTTAKETVMTTTSSVTTSLDVTTAPTQTTEAPAPKEYPIEGKTFMFLGSSVTYGSASGGASFVEYIKYTGKCTVIKEAVSGTTLVDNGSSSYVQRLVNILGAQYKDTKVDRLIVQLSTNDATQNKPLGKVSQYTESSKMNTQTIVGAIEFIIAYAKETWGCEVSFYTGTKYDSAFYKKMVDALYDVQEKWGIGILDLWNDPEMNAVSAKDYAMYMADPIHPTSLGYRLWWTPKFIAHLKQFP